ncbi:hypothetical protein QWY28_11465 [Nocardioides sp. SOB77]|uniref:Chemotaxis protein CheX n=1 Tax=Nocardioides oceani TaxID=3058369 RepID=A0ABT8FFV2_9ACTN|nr:hypothetical protein [Nocardioides oceani]MDN4173566.1 hypothetical protein [Nocardioides oceani]
MTLGTVETHLPGPKEVRDLLSGLLGREVQLRTAPPLVVSRKRPASVGVYVDARLVVRAVVVCDLPLSAYAAAAIALLPPPATEASLEAGGLDETLAENLHEVLNVAASMFNVPDAPHLKLHALHPAGLPLPGEVHGRTLTLGRREDLAVDVAGYGSGRLSVVLT